MATFDQFIASLVQDYGEQGKGKPFETFCKWFLENDPKWSKTVDTAKDGTVTYWSLGANFSASYLSETEYLHH